MVPGSVSVSEPLLAARPKGAVKMLLVVAGIALVAASTPALAEKPLKDYSFIRGVNYGMQGDQAVLDRDLGYAKRINLNSTRIWLNYQGYERDPQAYIDRLRTGSASRRCPFCGMETT